MRVLIVIPPIASVNYPTNEAGVCAAYLKKAGATVDILELNLKYLEKFERRWKTSLLQTTEAESTESLDYQRAIGFLFSEAGSLMLSETTLQDEQFHCESAKLIGEGQYDVVFYVYLHLRMYSSTIRSVIKLSKLVAKSSSSRQIFVGTGLRSLSQNAINRILSESCITTISLLDESQIARTLNDFSQVIPSTSISLDGILAPELEGFHLESYLNSRCGTKILNVYSSKGCLGSCNFCLEKKIFGDLIVRPIKEVASEMVSLAQNYHIDFFRFSDSMLNFSSEHFFALASAIYKMQKISGCSFRWGGMIKCPSVAFTASEAEILYQSGCRALWCGIESGAPEVLDIFNKLVHHDAALESCKHLTKTGISFISLWIKDGPWETEETLRMSINMQKRFIDAGSLVCNSPFIPFEQTNLGSSIEKFGVSILHKDDLGGALKTTMKYSCDRQELSNQLDTPLSNCIFNLDGMNIFTEL